MENIILNGLNVKELSGKKGLVVFFYPKAGTSGCSMEVREYNNKLEDFKNLGYNVVGISHDSEKDNYTFSCDYELKYPLISDVEEKYIKQFNVLGEKSMYGKTYIGVVRSTFVLDPNGKIIIEKRKVSPTSHVEELLEELTNLK